MGPTKVFSTQSFLLCGLNVFTFNLFAKLNLSFQKPSRQLKTELKVGHFVLIFDHLIESRLQDVVQPLGLSEFLVEIRC